MPYIWRLWWSTPVRDVDAVTTGLRDLAVWTKLKFQLSYAFGAPPSNAENGTNSSAVQPDLDRLPASFKQNATVNGHMASHQLLVDDFCTAVFFGSLPPVNAWQAARWTIPGLLAHQSALKDGEAMDVPDCGAPPEK